MKTQPSCLRLGAVLLAAIPLGASIPGAHATILTFSTAPPVATNATMPQDYGDHAAAESGLSADGTYQNEYQPGNGWTPSIKVDYSTQRAGEFPQYFHDNNPEWPGVCLLWSGSFRAGVPIGDLNTEPPKAMPAGFEYYFTFTPTAGNKGVILNSFVLDDRLNHFDSVSHVVQWRVVKGSPSGPILASGTETFSNGLNVTVTTGLTSLEATQGPVILVIKRMAGIEDGLAVDDIDFDETGLETLSYNTGSLGTAADGTNTIGVVLDQPGALASFNDHATGYSASERTTIPFQPALNPASGSPFTIEFWARPTASDNDDAPVFNRVSEGDRSGWTFFQRAPGIGWNLRMYSGTGSSLGWDLTGGSSTLEAWSHVVAVWTGSSARLYVNGNLASSTNAAGSSGIYRASDSATFSVGSYDNGGSPTNGSVDEIAFYPSALTAARILAHFNAASSAIPGTYSSLVLADGAALYLQQNPPSASITNPGPDPTVRFTGILSQSTDLQTWTDQSVTSPYTLPSPRPGQLFFRAHR